MERFRYVVAGGGAAGLALAYQLARSDDLPGDLLVIDEDPKEANDRTWCFWSRQPTPVDHLAYRTWDRISIADERESHTFDVAPYRYRMVRGIDYYRAMRAALLESGRAAFRLGTVTEIADTGSAALVHVDGSVLEAGWVFDSRYRPAEFAVPDPRYHHLRQHFLGWVVEAPAPQFDPTTVTLMDFRLDMRQQMRFMYVLPLSPSEALVEYTLFSADLLPQAEYEEALRRYLRDVLGLQDYRIVDTEQNQIPMTDMPFRRRTGPRVMAIGTRGGRVKASTGYSFLRAQRDAQAIVRSLARHGHPFDVPRPPARYVMFDRTLLQVLRRRGEVSGEAFMRLYGRNPIQRVFAFLDEEATLAQDLRLIATLPVGPFLASWWRSVVLGRV